MEICPYEVFTQEDGTVHVSVPEDCIECGACREECKAAAIYFDD
jgi:NAD-dependent dihydropyrimidine dehydrogenase PreA subunit